MNTIAIVADESVDFRIIQHLRLNNFTVYSILETSPSISDAEVLATAVKQNAL